jgi:glycerophosphoryl diester phosphodiesterase
MPHPHRLRRLLKTLAVGAAAVLLAGCASTLDLQGHRGARGLAPENTLAAFDAALTIGVTTLELDTVLTRDGTVVISHDTTLNPDITRNAQGQWLEARGPALLSLGDAELRQYDVGRIKPGTRYAQLHAAQAGVDGERIPTLAQLFERVAQRGNTAVRFNIETKLSPLLPQNSPEPEAFVRAVLAVVARHGVTHRVSLQSFDWRTLQVAQRIAPKVPTVYLSSQQSWGNNVADARWTAGLNLADHGSVPAMVKAAGGAVWSPYFGDVNEGLVRQAQSLGLKVVVWTVNEPADIERMLALKVDGIISDRPDRVRAAMAARSMALPRPALAP